MFVLWKYGRIGLNSSLLFMLFNCFGSEVEPFDAPYGFIHYPQSPHYILVLSSDPQLNEKIKSIKATIKFKGDRFEIPPLQVTNFQLPYQNDHWKLIQEFPNFGVAKQFMTRLALILNPVERPNKYDLFLISKTNYRHLLLKKSWDRYLEFYEELSD